MMLELTENEPSAPVDLSLAVVARLNEASSFWRKTLKLREEPLRIAPTGTGHYHLEARGVAGFIQAEELHLEIAPKFLNRSSCGPGWRSAMWRFLAYGYGIEALSDATGDAVKDDGIADILAELFLKSLRGALARGYPLGYSHVRKNGPFLRGRLDPTKFGKLLPVSGRLDFIAAQLSIDTPTNRLLKWAGRQLARSVEDPRRRQRLEAWSAELQGVGSAPPRRNSVPPPRRHHPYLVHAVEIAKLLQDDKIADYHTGELTIPGFLWDSERLFERAVFRLFQDSCRPLQLSVGKERLKLATTSNGTQERLTETTPDVTVQRSGRKVLHADAKYKVIKEHPINADFYQVLAAGRVSDVGTVVLVYPSQESNNMIKSYEPAGVGNPKRVYTIAIGLQMFSKRSGVRRLREELRDAVNLWLSQP